MRTDEPRTADRREFLSTVAMIAGLVGSYGALTLIASRFLYPARPLRRSWQFVVEADRMAVDDSLVYRTPRGSRVTIARRHQDGVASDFVALSSTCPHLGCQVRWESRNGRYFCPCHNGVFDNSGVGSGGPPANAGQSLPRYNLKLEEGLLYIEVDTEPLTSKRAGAPGRGSGVRSLRGPRARPV